MSGRLRSLKRAGSSAVGSTVSISIELFGTARMACGRKLIETRVPAHGSIKDLALVLARICPELVGVALRDDLSGLLASYTLNLNATEFVEGDELTLRDGDTLLLFSSQAGS